WRTCIHNRRVHLPHVLVWRPCRYSPEFQPECALIPCGPCPAPDPRDGWGRRPEQAATWLSSLGIRALVNALARIAERCTTGQLQRPRVVQRQEQANKNVVSVTQCVSWASPGMERNGGDEPRVVAATTSPQPQPI